MQRADIIQIHRQLLDGFRTIVLEHGKLDESLETRRATISTVEFGLVTLFLDSDGGLSVDHLPTDAPADNHWYSVVHFDQAGMPFFAGARYRQFAQNVLVAVKNSLSGIDPNKISDLLRLPDGTLHAIPNYIGANPPFLEDPEDEDAQLIEKSDESDWRIIHPPRNVSICPRDGMLIGVVFSPEIPGALLFQISFIKHLRFGTQEIDGLQELIKLVDQSIPKVPEKIKNTRVFLGGLSPGDGLLYDHRSARQLSQVSFFAPGLKPTQIYSRWHNDTQQIQSLIVNPTKQEVCYHEVPGTLE